MRNILALFGLISIVLVGMLYVQFKPYVSLFGQIDSETKGFILENVDKVSQMDPAVLKNYIEQAKLLDPKSYEVYLNVADILLKSGNSAEATIWKVAVEEGVSAEDVSEAMKSVANELNFSNVGYLPLSKDISSKKGIDYRNIELFLFCDSLIAAQMLEFSDSFSAYLPCRVALVEDNKGKLWLYTINMDMMIYGGRPLPKELKDQAMLVKKNILEIMHRGAEGDF